MAQGLVIVPLCEINLGEAKLRRRGPRTNAGCLVKGGDRLIVTLLQEQNATQVVIGAIGVEAETQGFARCSFRKQEIGRLLVGERPGKVIPSYRIVGIKADGLLEFLCGLPVVESVARDQA